MTDAEPESPLPPLRTVRVPPAMRSLFAEAERYVADYFRARAEDPAHGQLEFGGQRYILVRAASMSVHFFQLVKSLHGDLLDDAAAVRISQSVLFDVAHALGQADARAFHERMGVTDPIERLATGPVHFAHTGWAVVELHEESQASPDEDYCLIYDHPFSFESNAWRSEGLGIRDPVCVMGAGYSSGWCAESFGLPLRAAEILCQARGDAHCRFVMAPPARLAARIREYQVRHPELALATPTYASGESYFEQLYRVSAALEETERRYRALFADTHDAILVSALDGRLIESNAAGRTLLGLRDDAQDSPRLEELLVAPSHAELLDALRPAATFRGELRFRRADGAERVGLASVVRGRGVQGRTELRWIVHDITRRRQYEAHLRERQRLESLGSLAAGVAHDFNNLLAAILNSAAILEGALDDEALRDATATIRRAALHGSDLTTRLLSYGRGGCYQMRSVAPSDLVGSVAALLRPTLDPRIALALDLNADAPPIEVDEGQVETSLLNVCLNARDAMQDGGRLTISTRRALSAELAGRVAAPGEAGFAVIEVRDSGVGMNEAVLRRAREPFFTTKARGHGTGLGLAMVEGVLRNHQGFLDLDSTPGEGSTVRLFFPGSARPPERGAPEPAPPLVDQRSGRVLLVEDTETVARSTARLLELEGFAVETCPSGEEAIARLDGREPAPDVVILDLLLPGIDGQETLRRLRAGRPELRAVLCSGYAEQETVRDLIDNPHTRFVAKPFLLDALLAALDGVLGAPR